MICKPCTSRRHTDCNAPHTCPCQHRQPGESYGRATKRLTAEAPHLLAAGRR